MSILNKRSLKGICVGTVLLCALVQGWIMRHALIDCLPFKEMMDGYAIASIAMIIGPLASVIISIVLIKIDSLVRLSIAQTLVAGFICPFIFLVIYRLMTPAPELDFEAPDFSAQAAWASFSSYGLFVMVAGLICTSILLSLMMSLYTKSASARAQTSAT